MAYFPTQELLDELSRACGGTPFEIRHTREHVELWKGRFQGRHEILERFKDINRLRLYVQGMLAGIYECRG